MAIQLRFAQQIDPADVPKVEDGTDGAPGETGPAGRDLKELPVKYVPLGVEFETLIGTQSRNFRLELSENTEIRFSSFPDGAIFHVSLRQDSGGGHTVTWGTAIRWAGGVAPTLSAEDNHIDTLRFERWFHGEDDFYTGAVVGLDMQPEI